MPTNTYQTLVEHTKKLRLLEAVSALLEWDQETYMPKGASHARAEQLELLASICHEQKTHSSYANLLASFIDLETGQLCCSHLSQQQIVSLKLLQRDYKKQAALPNKFVKQFAKLCSQSHGIWAEARQNNNFSLFAPYLEKIIEMSRQKADYIGFKDHPYDALLDHYEPDMTCAQLDPLFQALGQQLHSFVQQIQKQPRADTSILHGTFAEQQQLDFGKLILEKVGYSFDFGRLDLSTHPFSTSFHPTDSRITSRIHKTSVLDCLSAILHEAGHGLYEMGLPQDFYGTPICEAISLGIHESQSRFWETFIGQSQQFWQYFYPLLAQTFPAQLGHVSLDQFYRAMNAVHPSVIRIEADEVTYCLHILVRYEIEKALIKKELSVKDIPDMWNMLMKRFLGVEPASDQEGCLQDIHWSMGGFGYFPTYALGNLYAAQIFATFETLHPDWGQRLAKEQSLNFVTTWLRCEIHEHGHLYSAEELIKRVTGQALSPEPYLRYLKNKYTLS
ncbi:MAG: carboxypeptidase M32 [Verrucomicrobia bacterium]|nr:carboxypeptidase M32 [Verrucomicrobiota bacterium]MBS0647481.1 carboxypeptidase M32 [Verrucomicrobiota bacterium]